MSRGFWHIHDTGRCCSPYMAFHISAIDYDNIMRSLRYSQVRINAGVLGMVDMRQMVHTIVYSYNADVLCNCFLTYRDKDICYYYESWVEEQTGVELDSFHRLVNRHGQTVRARHYQLTPEQIRKWKQANGFCDDIIREVLG